MVSFAVVDVLFLVLSRSQDCEMHKFGWHSLSMKMIAACAEKGLAENKRTLVESEMRIDGKRAFLPNKHC